MGIYLSTPKTDKFSEDGENDRLSYGLSSMQGWRATMEDAHAAYPDLDDSTSFFGVYDGHGGKVVAKFCAKYLHQQVLKHEAYAAGDLSTPAQRAFLRMDEMMHGQRGWRELAILGDKIDKFSRMIERFIWSPRSTDTNEQTDDWHSEEVQTGEAMDCCMQKVGWPEIRENAQKFLLKKREAHWEGRQRKWEYRSTRRTPK